MKSILCVALVATLALTNVEAAGAGLPKGNIKPQKDKSSYLKNETKDKL